MSIVDVRNRINEILCAFVSPQNTQMLRVEQHRDSFNVQEINVWTNIAIFTINNQGPHQIKVVLSTHSPHSIELFDNDSEAPAKIVRWIGSQPEHSQFAILTAAQQSRRQYKFNFKLEVVYKGDTVVMGVDADEAVKALRSHLESIIPNNYSVSFVEASASATEEAELRTFRLDDLAKKR